VIGLAVVLAVILVGTIIGPLVYWLVQGCPPND
jgi:hypothetical protein